MEKNSEALTILLVMALLIMNTSIILAQHQQGKPPVPPNEQEINRMVEDMASELSLTKEQKTKIIALYKEHFAEMQKLMESGKTQREEMREKHEQMRQQFEKGLKAVMKNDQLKKFEIFMKKLEEQHSKQMPKHDGPQGGK